MTGKRSVLVSLSRSRVRVCIKLLTAPDFCNGRTWCRSCPDRGIAPLRDRLQHAEAELSQLKPISVAGCAALCATEDLAAGEGRNGQWLPRRRRVIASSSGPSRSVVSWSGCDDDGTIWQASDHWYEVYTAVGPAVLGSSLM